MSISSTHKVEQDQPRPITPPTTTTYGPGPDSQTPTGSNFRSRISHIKARWTTRHGWLGDYDYAWLCTPTLPFTLKGKKRRAQPPFYALEADLPILLAMSSGLQHALAMLAGLITPPIIFASALSLDSELSAYMISASLIGCGEYWSDICYFVKWMHAEALRYDVSFAGILSLVQMSRLPLFGGYYLGTGLLSVVGTSFATLSTANAVRRLLSLPIPGTTSLIVSTCRFLMQCTRTAPVKLLLAPMAHQPASPARMPMERFSVSVNSGTRAWSKCTTYLSHDL